VRVGLRVLTTKSSRIPAKLAGEFRVSGVYREMITFAGRQIEDDLRSKFEAAKEKTQAGSAKRPRMKPATKT